MADDYQGGANIYRRRLRRNFTQGLCPGGCGFLRLASSDHVEFFAVVAETAVSLHTNQRNHHHHRGFFQVLP